MIKRQAITVTPSFTDAEFTTAEEKRKVLKNWERFVKNGFQFKHFTRALYNHLIQHCSFIAHYNQQGFHAVYFEDPEATRRFLDQFDRAKGCVSVEYGMTYWIMGGNDVSSQYYDLNNAMVDVLEPLLVQLRQMLKTKEMEMAESQLEAAQRNVEALHGREKSDAGNPG